VLVFWLAIVFASFGHFAPSNATVITTLFLCALAVSGAIFLTAEMYTPFKGLIQISSAPLRNALAGPSHKFFGFVRRSPVASCSGSNLPGRTLSRLAPTDVGMLCAFLKGREKCGLEPG